MNIERKDKQQKTVEQPGRRRALKTAAAVVGTAAVSAPFIRSAVAAETTTWKVQTSWPAGVGLQTFKAWCGTIKEKTGGELEFKPFAAKEVVGDFELIDGVKNGVLEAMNSFTLYWAGKLPATAFLSSYLMGLRYPHEWDMVRRLAEESFILADDGEFDELRPVVGSRGERNPVAAKIEIANGLHELQRRRRQQVQGLERHLGMRPGYRRRQQGAAGRGFHRPARPRV